jgi:hypothetical protein
VKNKPARVSSTATKSAYYTSSNPPTGVTYGWQSPDRIRLVIWTGAGPARYDNSRSSEYDVDRIDPKAMISGAVQIHRR